MKKNLHPPYYPKAKAICACGNQFETSSTVPEIQVEVCSACHPYYTGKQKLVDSAGRVDRFRKIVEKGTQIKSKRAKR